MTKARDLANASTALSAVSATELGYVDGVTSAIQTQMDAKAPSSTAVTLTGTQTLTNKTLTNPVISSVINNTLTSTTGDIIYASAANTPARLGIGSSAQVLTVSSGIPAWTTLAPGGGDLYSQDFTSSGTFNVPSGVDKVIVWAVGGGGAGGGCASGAGTYQAGGGGGGGQVKYEPIAVTAGSSVTVTIGAGGTGGTGNGGDGGSTTFGGLLTALGGSGGTANDSANTPAVDGMNQGGSGDRDNTNYQGGGGGGGATSNGGSAYVGTSGTPSTLVVRPGRNPNNLGSAGGAAARSNIWHFGGNGGAGWRNKGGGGGAYGPMGGAYGVDGGGYNSTSASNNGTANSGGGGGGANTSSNSNANGGNGGSGFLQVIWVAS
jgi:hypothetical protein